mmetsp:Transcript_48722/g.105627  ORF Transcript_48722/g.105627 Transcript_48722/m.105627 type:complete len:449 (+) Transcript_48722:110-1456(+)
MGCGASKSSAVNEGHEAPLKKPQAAANTEKSASQTSVNGTGQGASCTKGTTTPRPTYAPCLVLLLGSEASMLPSEELHTIVKAAGGSFLEVDELIREEIKSGTPEGSELAQMIRQGKILSSANTIALVKRAVVAKPPPHCLAGFPKSVENLARLEEEVSPCVGSIYLDMDEAEQQTALASRGHDEARVRRKLAQFKMQTLPVVEALESRGLLTRVKAAERERAITGVREVLAIHTVPSADSANGASETPTGVSGEVQIDRHVVYVLGYSGDLKDEICTKIAENMHGDFFSASGLLKQEMKSMSKLGVQITDMIRQGKIVPASVIVQLLQSAIAASQTTGPVLIDGFPRSADTVQLFEQQVCKPRLALLLESSDKSLQELIKQQQSQIGSGDQSAVISRKLQSFRAQLKPLTEAMEEAKMLRKLDANKPTKAIVAAAVKQISDAMARAR